jgi:hypothetical protein
MSGDSQFLSAYASLMREEPEYITLTLKHSEPIEIGDFVSAFVGIANQYEKFLKTTFPDLSPNAQMFVRDVRHGSIEVDIVGTGLVMLQTMEHLNTMRDFCEFYGKRIAAYFMPGGREAAATKGDIKDFMGAVAAIARDPEASATLQSAHFEDGKAQQRVALTFDTQQARQALEQLEQHKREIEHLSGAGHPRVLMVFSQSNVKDVELGKRSGERVIIEAISKKELPIVYSSEIAEQRIKYEIREASDNVYKKGFEVDVNVESRAGKPIAYRIVTLHQVIDLPDDEDD